MVLSTRAEVLELGKQPSDVRTIVQSYFVKEDKEK
jgi:hypothetical protein